MNNGTNWCQISGQHSVEYLPQGLVGKCGDDERLLATGDVAARVKVFTDGEILSAGGCGHRKNEDMCSLCTMYSGIDDSFL